MIKLNKITKMYSSNAVLDDVSFDIDSGSIIGLVGENGAGKSTIMKILTGLIKNYDGSIITEKNDLNIGYLIENPSFYKNYDAKTNLRYLGVYRNFSNKDIEYIFELFNLDQFGDKPFHKYSLGMKQRLGIAFAMIGNPDLLILDEPFNGLDPTQVFRILEIFKKWVSETNGSIFISSHVLSQLDMICNKVIFINKGKKVKEVNINTENNCSVYTILLEDSDKNLYDYLIENNIEILKYDDYKKYTIKIIEHKEIYKYIIKNFDVSEFYKEKETLENMYRKIEGLSHE